jgi:DNA-binding NarL/FixJ family response regulator
MASLRVLILPGTIQAHQDQAGILAGDRTVAVVAPGEPADVTLVDLTTGWNPAPAPAAGPVLFLVPENGDPAVGPIVVPPMASVVTDGVSRDRLVAALRAVAAGFTVREPAADGVPLRVRADPAMEPEPGLLTEREREILRLLGEGLGNHDIARTVQLSDHTVKSHLRSIYQKLGVRTRTEAVTLAVRRGLLML